MTTARQLREMSEADLQSQLIDLRRQQLETRIQMSTGQFADTAKFKEYRRDIARIKTILNEMQDK